MKRILSLIIILSVLFSATVFASANDTFYESFENGFHSKITTDSKQKVIISDETSADGKFSAHVSKRTKQEVALWVDVTEFITKGTYLFSVALKLDDDIYEFSRFYAGIRITTDKGVTEFKTEITQIVNERFTKCEDETIISWEGNLESAVFFIANKSVSEQGDLFIDDIRIQRLSEEIIEEEAEIEFSELTVGAIKKDIWFEGNLQAQENIKKLSLERYNRYLPFNYDLGTKQFLTVAETVDNDLKYAEYMGIDFFAYYASCCGDTIGLHSKSSSKVKFCLIIDQSDQISKIGAYLKDSKYLSVDGKAVVFVLENLVSKIGQIKSAASAVSREALVTVISSKAAQADIADMVAVKTDSEEYFDFEKRLWNNSSKHNIIPVVTAFDGEGKNRDKIKAHLSSAVAFAKNKTNCVLIDSWNSYDSFTNIVPSYKADAFGNVLYENGRYLLNTDLAEFLNAQLGGNKSVSIKVTSGTAPSTDAQVTPAASDSASEQTVPPTIEVTPSPNVTNEPTALPTPSGSDDFGDVERVNEPDKFVIGLVVSVVVIICASVIKILIEKRKKNGKKS
ncbi:MAG: hypothetical protein IKB86_02475 [Clostridia bacterium]|nr:hypothetical protein [Clostridia bacterium]